jgi:hypothetical protein
LEGKNNVQWKALKQLAKSAASNIKEKMNKAPEERLKLSF